MEMEIAHGWPGYSDLTAGPPYQEGDKALGQLTRDCREGDGDGLIYGARILFDYMADRQISDTRPSDMLWAREAVTSSDLE